MQENPSAATGAATPVVTKASKLYDWVEAAVFSLVCVAAVFTFLFRVVGVNGASMENTLHDQDRLLLVSSFYQPAHGDIVVINQEGEEPLIKRIIAMEGDVIDLDEVTHQVILNGTRLEEPYVAYPTYANGCSFPLELEEGQVFVMGDHRTDSKDSRSSTVGLIDVEDIAGKAVFRIWPLQAIGPLS